MITKQKGFTLVELLVVIAILGIIMTAAIVAINPTEMLKKSRDARRVSDVTAISKAITSGVADQGLIVATTGTSVNSTSNNWQTLGGLVSAVSPNTLATYISKVPVDPTNDATAAVGLVYRFGVDATGFEVSAKLESTDSQARYAAKDGGNDALSYEVGTAPLLNIF